MCNSDNQIKDKIRIDILKTIIDEGKIMSGENFYFFGVKDFRGFHTILMIIQPIQNNGYYVHNVEICKLITWHRKIWERAGGVISFNMSAGRSKLMLKKLFKRREIQEYIEQKIGLPIRKIHFDD